MLSNQKLFSVGNFDFRLQHLLVIGVLALSVSISMLIRSTPASYGLELFEFDPFFNFRATEYVLENGPDAYFNWIDEKTWHPFGRNVSENSQVTLHLTAAALYQIFGFGTSLYHFTILFPMIIGSLTTIVVFAFVRVLGGTTAGLFAALIFSISVPIFTRGLIGWFKSEPLGLFFAFLAIYLFVSGIKFNRGKISFVKLLGAGVFLSLGLSAWGGIMFFVIAIALFFFTLPFVKTEKNFLIWAIPVFSVSMILSSLLFERTSSFIFGFTGILILLPTFFVIISEIITKISNEKNRIRNCFIFLISIVLSGSGIFALGLTGLPSFRYLNAINPFLTSTDPLTDSVAEHTTTELAMSFAFLSVFLIFAAIGMWFIFSKKSSNIKNDMRAFILVTSIIAIYLSSTFVRLELFASFAIIIFGSIGLSILFKKIFETSENKLIKLIFSGIILIMFVIPIALPEDNGWTNWADFPPSILNGGTAYPVALDDWQVSMNWLKENSPEDSVIAAWWDYGYWITTLSDRTTLVDNATLGDFQIKKLAYALTTDLDKSWHILHSDYTTDITKSLGEENVLKFEGSLQSEFDTEYRKVYGKDCEIITKSDSIKLDLQETWCNPVNKGMDADFILIYVAGERIPYNDQLEIYTLESGGDESKKHWIVKISEQQVSKFVQGDGITPTNHFMEETTMGKLIPFSIVTYVEPSTDRVFENYQNGLIPVYVKDIKLNDINDPFYLVYASPSFYSSEPGFFGTVLIYKINSNYNSSFSE